MAKMKRMKSFFVQFEPKRCNNLTLWQERIAADIAAIDFDVQIFGEYIRRERFPHSYRLLGTGVAFLVVAPPVKIRKVKEKVIELMNELMKRKKIKSFAIGGITMIHVYENEAENNKASDEE